MPYAVEVAARIERELPPLPGWCTVEKGRRMAELTRGAALCVELGVFGGRGLVAMALALQGQGFGRVDGIDPFAAAASLEGSNSPANDEWWASLDYEAIARAAQEALYRLELMPYAHLVRMYSRDAVAFYADGSVNVLHQDSNHSEEISSEEVTLWAPKIKAGGYWILDDADWSTTQKAQRMLEGLGFVEAENYERWKVYRKVT